MTEGIHSSAQLAQVGRLALKGWLILKVHEKTGTVVMGDALGARWVIDRLGFVARAMAAVPKEASRRETREDAP